MNRDEVIAFAHESAKFSNKQGENVFEFTFEELRRAFEAVAAHEREACAKVCDNFTRKPELSALQLTLCADAIRARAIKETA